MDCFPFDHFLLNGNSLNETDFITLYDPDEEQFMHNYDDPLSNIELSNIEPLEDPLLECISVSDDDCDSSNSISVIEENVSKVKKKNIQNPSFEKHKKNVTSKSSVVNNDCRYFLRHTQRNSSGISTERDDNCSNNKSGDNKNNKTKRSVTGGLTSKYRVSQKKKSLNLKKNNKMSNRGSIDRNFDTVDCTTSSDATNSDFSEEIVNSSLDLSKVNNVVEDSVSDVLKLAWQLEINKQEKLKKRGRPCNCKLAYKLLTDQNSFKAKKCVDKSVKFSCCTFRRALLGTIYYIAQNHT
ncbi:uncharacterized protein LOC142321835 [Lycorma delicatula]|uniref:uncharacterized protein LOC142321835 n=1 Tax=Lycorma delicatula TaxID=130591 RepID=UPI003F512D38